LQDDDSVTAAAVDLSDWGWSDARAAQLVDAAHEGLEPARVLAEHRSGLRVVCARGERDVTVAGRLRHVARQRGQLPCVGDWVLIDAVPLEAAAMVRAVLPRSSRFARGTAGRRDQEQVVAANIDVVWLANALDQPLGARRLERFLAVPGTRRRCGLCGYAAVPAMRRPHSPRRTRGDGAGDAHYLVTSLAQ
jgi:ribosome biogenesis GTPase / thiamine phosphate phosphatase